MKNIPDKLGISMGIIFLMAAILAGCANQQTAPTDQTASNQPENANPVVAQINNLELTLSDLNRELAFDRAIYLLTTGKELTQQDPVEKLERLSTTLLIDQQARQAGISATEAEIAAALENFTQTRNITTDTLQAALQQQGYTLDDFKQNLARTIRAEKYLTRVIFADAQTPEQQTEKLAALVTELQQNANIKILYQPPKEAPVVGAMAPNFTLTNLNGKEVSLSQFRGRPVILNFWATWCVPCRREMPALQQAFQTHQPDGLAVLAINLKEDAALVEPFVDELGLSFEILYDSQGEVNKTYTVAGLPRTIFIDRQGVIQHIQVGELQEILLQGFLGRIL